MLQLEHKKANGGVHKSFPMDKPLKSIRYHAWRLSFDDKG